MKNSFVFLLLIALAGFLASCEQDDSSLLAPVATPEPQQEAEALLSRLLSRDPALNSQPLPLGKPNMPGQEGDKKVAPDCGCTVQFLSLPPENSVWSLRTAYCNPFDLSSGFFFNFGQDYLCENLQQVTPYPPNLLNQIFPVQCHDLLDGELEFILDGFPTDSYNSCADLLYDLPFGDCEGYSGSLSVSFRVTCNDGFSFRTAINDYTLTVNKEELNICTDPNAIIVDRVTVPIKDCLMIAGPTDDFPGAP